MSGLLPFEKIKREILIRSESQTSSKYGYYPKDTPTKLLLKTGLINMDKPAGPTSHQVAEFTKNIIGIDKAGHCGTLDPNVTGVLPILLGRGTKAVIGIQQSGKEYVCVMHLHSEVKKEKLEKMFKQFTGRIRQLPPIKSAIKREWRYRKIYYIDLHEIDGKEILFTVGCQAGTYIRKLCHDIGEELNVGAHMAELRRTKAGSMDESTLCTLQDLKDAMHYYNKGDDSYIKKCVQPIEEGVKHLPKVYIHDNTVYSVAHGANLNAPGISKVESEIQVDELVAIMTLKGEFIGYGDAKMTSKEMVEKEKGLAVITTKVFMDSEIYPKAEKE